MFKNGFVGERKNLCLFISIVFIYLSFLFSIFATLFISFLIGAMLFYFISLPFIKEEKKKFKFLKLDFLLIAFFLLVFFRGFFTKNILLSIGASLPILFYILVMLFFRNFPFKDDDLKKIVDLISILLLCSTIFALVHYFFIRETITIKLFGNVIHEFYGRKGVELSPLSSIFDHSTGGGVVLSLLSGIVLLWMISVWGKEKSLLRKITFVAVLLLSYVTIALTVSRSGILTVLFTLLFVIVLTRKYWLLVIPLIFTLCVTFLPIKKLQQTVRNPLDSFNIPPRILQVKVGLEFFKENPVFGIGLMQFRDRFKKYPQGKYPHYFFLGVEFLHNGYIALLTETGITGFLLFFSYIIINLCQILEYLRKNTNREPQYKNFAGIYGLFMLLWFFFDSVFNAHLYVVPIGVFFWIALGISQNPLLNKNIEE